MRLASFILAALAVFFVTVNGQIQVNNFQFFPTAAGGATDGTYLWAATYDTQLQATTAAAGTFTTALCPGASRFGAYQFDFKCRNAGPANARAIVCTAGQGCGSDPTNTATTGCLYPGYDQLCLPASTGISVNPRNADSYLVYGRGANVGPAGNTVFQPVKPVWAFDLYKGPSPGWVRVANSLDELFNQGLNRALALSQSTVPSATAPGTSPFSFFFINTANSNSGVDTVGTFNNPVDAPGNMAWTGCSGFKTAGVTYGRGGTAINPALTCFDWTFATRDTARAIGIQGNPGYVPYTSTTFVTDWLNNNRIADGASQGPSAAGAACNIAAQYIYCSWHPMNTDGIKNGDETGVDCGGTTLGELNSGNPTPNCTCAPGFYQLYNFGRCIPCPVNTYCRSAGGCGVPGCQACHQFGTTVNAQGIGLTGQTQCVCRTGYAYPVGFNPAVTGVYDGSYCQLIVRGDPQITGLQGQDFQVHGIPDEFFNLISTPELQVNSRFVYLEDAKCDNYTTCFTHPGTYIDQIGIMTAEGDKVKVLAGTIEQGLRVFVNGKEIKVGHKMSLKNLKIHFSEQRKVHVRTPLFALAFLNSDMFMNQEVALLDTKLAKKGAKVTTLTQGQERPNQDVAIHGIVGQTWQNIKYPEGMFIEGAVADYRLEESELFGMSFVYNQFQPKVDIVA